VTGTSDRVPAWAIRIAAGIVLAALVAYSAWQRWQALAVSPFPLGVDGYFYPIEVRSLLEHGTLQYPASPLTFWFMAPFAAATDPITGAKLGAAIGGALIALPAYAVGVRLGRGGRGAGLVAAVLAAQLASSQYLSTEFVKQGFGLTVGLTALWLLLRALDQPSRMRIGVALAGLVATLLTHKLATALVIVIAVPAIIEEARGRAVLRGRRLLYLLTGIASVVVALAVLGLVAPQRFVGAGDLALATHVVHAHAEWGLPALAMPHYRLVFDHETTFGFAAAIAALAVVFAVPYDRKAHGPRVVAWIMIGIALLVALPWLAVDDPQGLGFRLRIAAHVPAALCAASAIGTIPEIWRTHVRDLVLAAAVVLVAWLMPVDRAEGRVLAHPALVSAVMAAQDQIPSNATVIVPERHILFMVAWYTRAKVSLRPEPVPYPQRVRMMPLAFIGMDSPLDHALDDARKEPGIDPPLGLHARHRNGLVLVTEPTWDWLMARLAARGTYWARWPTI
jgi:hypothetical protein